VQDECYTQWEVLKVIYFFWELVGKKNHTHKTVTIKMVEYCLNPMSSPSHHHRHHHHITTVIITTITTITIIVMVTNIPSPPWSGPPTLGFTKPL
jgi:hypothetical protein